MDLEEVVLKAGTAYSEGRYEDALQFYRRAILGHPHNAALHANVSAILSRLSRYEDALHHADIAVCLEPKWGKASYRKGEALRSLGDYRTALMSFCTALRYESPTKQCLSALKESATRAFYAFPLEEMKRLQLQDDPSALLSTIGQLYLSEGSYQDSISVLTWSLQLNSSCLTFKSSTMACLGAAHFKMDNLKRAMDYYEQQLEVCQQLGSGEIRALENIAMSSEAAHEWELALDTRRKIFNHAKVSPEEKEEERQTIAELLLQRGRGEEAFFLLDIKPQENLRGRVNLACARAYTGDGAGVISILLPLRPADEAIFARAVTAVSRYFTEVGKLRENVDYLEGIMKHTTVKGQNLVWKKACTLCCKTYLRIGNIDSSLNLAKRLLRISRSRGETELDALQLLAICYEQQGDHASAAVLLQKCLVHTKSLVEITRLYLNLARVVKLNGQDPEEYLQSAARTAECTNDCQLKAQSNSEAIRYYKEMRKLAEAENLLEKQKKLLYYDLNGTTRSIIFEDLALLAAEEGGSASSVLTLEQSLDEAQEDNNIQRELELLERLGDQLVKLDRRKEAEAIYHRFLALAKQLRSADAIQRGHEKLAVGYRSDKNWKVCLEHARSALTIAKIQQDTKGRIRMFLLMGYSESQRGDQVTAVYILKKALGLADAGQLTDFEAEAHFQLGHIFETERNHKMAELHYTKLINTEEEPSHKLCSVLAYLAKRSEPVAAVRYLKQCREMAGKLEKTEKEVHIRSCFSTFLELNFIDEAVSCLKEVDHLAVCLQSLFDFTLYKQLPFLLRFHGSQPHFPQIHSRLLLLGPYEKCEQDPTCHFISLFHKKDWSTLLSISNYDSLDRSVLPDQVLEVIILTANWYLNRNIPTNVDQLSEEIQLFLHSISWTHCHWSSIPFIRNKIYQRDSDLLTDDFPLLDKIVCGVLTGQTELVPMWFEEMLVIMRGSSLSPFEWLDQRKNILLAAAFVALAEKDPLSQIWILEITKWELDKHLLASHSLGPPNQVLSLLFTEKYNYLYSLEDVDLVWVRKQDELQLFMAHLSPSPVFHVHLLTKLLRHMGVKNLENGGMEGLLVANSRSSFCVGRIVPWIRETTNDKRPYRSIWLLTHSILIFRGSVQCDPQKRIQNHKKFSSSHVVIIDSDIALSHHEILSTGAAPDILLSMSPLRFELITAFFLLGTKAVIEVENAQQVAIQIFVDQLRMGDSVRVCASHLKCRIYGDVDFRIESDATLCKLRRIIKDDPDSFLFLAKSWKQGEPWNFIGSEILTLSSEQLSLLLPLLDDLPTELVNELYNHSEPEGQWVALSDVQVKKQWTRLYDDHLFLLE